MRAALIKDGFVINILEVPDLNIIPNLVDATYGGSIGDRWDGYNFIPQDTPHG